MNILVITEDEELFLPLSIDRFLTHKKDQVSEVVLARNPLLKSTMGSAARFLKVFGPVPTLKLAMSTLKAKLLNTLPILNTTGRYFSVEKVCQAHDVPCRYEDNINSQEFLDHCRQLQVDIVASVSPTQIFKEGLINLPQYGCINIHTAKLPKYRGLYPTYWAMACGEKTLGISIHYMEKGIDTGKILLQDEIPILPRATMREMMTKSKIRGIELLIDAIEQLENGTSKPFCAEGEGSYHSFPTPESYREFLNHGYRIW